MENIILSLILLLILGGAIVYIYKAKKRGVKCIGCSACGKCNGACLHNNCVEEEDYN